jgi:phosphoribosylaminoimidazole-succinocarboxamide synthase
MQALTSIDLSGLDVFASGKVRCVYDLGEKLLIVASDRISAFDRVLPSGIPDKGRILTAVSAFWFRRLAAISKHHMISDSVEEFPDELKAFGGIIKDRSMLVWKAKRIGIECIVRGYLAGSAWKEYAASGMVAGTRLPAGLKQNDRLQQPVFTPSTKADEGHDVNISIGEMTDLVGAGPAEHLVATSISLFAEASRIAGERGIEIIDTKFEFGYLDGDIVLIDEALTPDSSRFRVRELPESEPINVDKQFVRDYLEALGWDKTSSPPVLPQEIIEECRRRYLMLYQRLTGSE